jgi:pimeloyl-ACP methyl ester carboxylesterase
MRNPTFAQLIATACVGLTLLATTGCAHVPNGNLAEVAPVSDGPRAGNVYLLRGWIGVFSTGIDTLGQKVNDAGVRGRVYQDGQWRELAATIAEKYRDARNPEPLVLVGHSYGADDVVNIARALEHANVTVDLLVTIDPTTPPAVPKNVKHCYNLYQPNVLDALPMLRGIPLEAEEGFAGKLQNVNIRTDRPDLLEGSVNHFNIEKKDAIHREALRQILAVCPPRPVWAAANRPQVPVATVTPVSAAHGRAPLPRVPATRPAAPPRVVSTSDDTARILRD